MIPGRDDLQLDDRTMEIAGATTKKKKKKKNLEGEGSQTRQVITSCKPGY